MQRIGKGQSVIYSEEEKCQLMEQLGMDVLISYPFDKETSRLLHQKSYKVVQAV